MSKRKTNAQLLREIAERDPAEHGQRLARGYGVGPDRMIPVPKSLIDQVRVALGFHVGEQDALYRAVDALLDQPEPSVAPEVDVCFYCHGAGYYDGGDMRDDEPCNACRDTGLAEPPRMEDMAPGTTCDANGCNARPRWISAGGFHWCDEHKPFPSRPLDPSTIRDVREPEGGPMHKCIECEEPARYAGQCLRHYEDVRWWQNVAPAEPDVCWPWLGLSNRQGYGRFRSRLTNSTYAHRIALLRVGRDPGEMKVLHRCDNPPCVNPAHLFIGSLKDNTLDMVTKRRHGTAKATPELVAEWRTRREAGEPYTAIAREVGMDPSSVRRAVLGIFWAHVTPPPTTPEGGR